MHSAVSNQRELFLKTLGVIHHTYYVDMNKTVKLTFTFSEYTVIDDIRSTGMRVFSFFVKPSQEFFEQCPPPSPVGTGQGVRTPVGQPQWLPSVLPGSGTVPWASFSGKGFAGITPETASLLLEPLS